MSAAADHFGHRESDGIIVDLYWNGEGKGQFRVEVVDEREGTRFVLRPTTGREAVQAFLPPIRDPRQRLHERGASGLIA